MSDPEMDDIVENMLDQPDLSPHDLEVLRISAEFAARVVALAEENIGAYEELHHVTITQTDRFKTYGAFFECIVDDLYEDGQELAVECLEEALKDSSTDYAVPG